MRYYRIEQTGFTANSCAYIRSSETTVGNNNATIENLKIINTIGQSVLKKEIFAIESTIDVFNLLPWNYITKAKVINALKSSKIIKE